MTPLVLTDVSVRVDGALLLDDVDWRVDDGQRWVILGPNGAGKTTLVRVASLHLHPTAGRVQVLGEDLGHTDVRTLRIRIGVVSPAVAALIRPNLTVGDLVCSARHGALVPWWLQVTDADRERAAECLDLFGVADRSEQPFATLSTGERQRVLLARALVTDPGLLVLDEPMAGLDVGGREGLVADLGRLAADPTTPATVLVTHHLEEIPAGFTHALVLVGGRIRAQGPIEEVVADAVLSDAYGLALRVDRESDRWTARLR